jgi:hypothetical protein
MERTWVEDPVTVPFKDKQARESMSPARLERSISESKRLPRRIVPPERLKLLISPEILIGCAALRDHLSGTCR